MSLKILWHVQSRIGSKQDMYDHISTQKNSMIQFGAKERLDGDKSSMEESRDIGWNTKATQKHQKEE